MVSLPKQTRVGRFVYDLTKAAQNIGEAEIERLIDETVAALDDLAPPATAADVQSIICFDEKRTPTEAALAIFLAAQAGYIAIHKTHDTIALTEKGRQRYPGACQ